MKVIQKWDEMYDELHELQKIFFTFMKRWTESDRHTTDCNALHTYVVNSDEETFELAEDRRRFE